MIDNTAKISFSKILKLSLRIGLSVSLIIGILESLVIAVKVVLSNTITITLVLNLIKFISISAAIYVPILVLFAVLISLLYYILILILKGKVFQIESWLVRLSWFCGILFTLLVWVNFNSTRPILSGKSILINITSVLLSLLIAKSVYRIFYHNSKQFSLIKSKKSQRLMITWIALLIFSFFYNVDEGFNKDHSRPNIILIIVDTLRADRVGSYGYDKDTTPNIDHIAKQGVQFEQAYVQWASSLPSHSSIMTSLQPYLHGAFPNGNQLNPEVLTLAKILKAYGYTNGAFVTNRLVGNQYNFEIGFERFFDLANITYSNSTKTAWMHSLNLIKVFDKLKQNDIFTDLALSWIEDNKDDPIFLWLQLFYPHAPYESPSKFLKKFEDSYAGIADGTLEQISLITKNSFQLSVEDQDHYSAIYDGEVAYSDYQIGRVINKLRELNILENSLIVITSDHGENEERLRSLGYIK